MGESSSGREVLISMASLEGERDRVRVGVRGGGRTAAGLGERSATESRVESEVRRREVRIREVSEGGRGVGEVG